MIVYPAIDLRGGRVVRLKEGDPNRQTLFSDDPLNTAQQWIDQGAKWLHVVNLDGAFEAENNNLAVLQQIARLNVSVQFGGGLRNMVDIAHALELGAKRAVLGTVAIKQPDIVVQAVERFGADAICVALDARDGKITTHGWQQATELTPLDYGRFMAQQGVRHALYTDVARDGQLTGSDVERTIALGRDSGLQVIASGGVATVAEITQLAASGTVAGVIIGMALYEGRLTLTEALNAARNQDAG